jgi:hypothetical protein
MNLKGIDDVENGCIKIRILTGLRLNEIVKISQKDV